MLSNQSGMAKRLILSVVLFVPAMMAVLFLPAGTLNYWQAWVYLLILLIPAGFTLTYFYKTAPDFIQRRMNYNERRQTQRGIVGFGNLAILLAFILPGLDQRWGWSQVSVWLVILADIGVFLGYALIVRVFMENRYASRVVEVSSGQQVIRSGPYAVVRHPMYVGAILMYVFSQLALGSYWAVLPALMIIPVLVMRILDEEILLNRDLPGYSEYTHQVRDRLIPGIW
jgi:protein-S-isoprenylcysteine O-methyltransferase Ste14